MRRSRRRKGRDNAGEFMLIHKATPHPQFLPASTYALAASRHIHEFGTTREQLAAVAVAAREWALLNPAAGEKEPLTIEGVLSSRIVSYPFTVRDCCLVTDGGGAIVVTSAERAKSLRKARCGQSVTHASISSMPDLTVTGALTAGKAAYARPSSVRPTSTPSRSMTPLPSTPGGPRLLQERRGRCFRQRRAHRSQRLRWRTATAGFSRPKPQ